MKLQITFSIELIRNGNDNNNFTKVSWNRLRQLVKKRDGAICYYCGIYDEDGHVDHKLPLSRGGTDELTNLVWSCSSCNCSKGNKTDKEFVEVDYEDNYLDDVDDDHIFIEAKSGNPIRKSRLYEMLEGQVKEHPDGFTLAAWRENGWTRNIWSIALEILSDIGLITEPIPGKSSELRYGPKSSLNAFAKWVGDELVYADDDIEKENDVDTLKYSGIEEYEQASYDEDIPLMKNAIRVYLRDKKVSKSILQRRLSIGYNRASRIFEKLEDRTIINLSDNGKYFINESTAMQFLEDN